jgi:hypothetical protein
MHHRIVAFRLKFGQFYHWLKIGHVGRGMIAGLLLDNTAASTFL